MELSSQAREGLRETMEDILTAGVERGLVTDATIAESLEQAKAFWRMREIFADTQKHEGGSIKHDVSVPVAASPPSSSRPTPPTKLIPGARPCRSAISATATSTTTSTSRQAPTGGVPRALGRGQRGVFAVVQKSAARSRPSTASA